jgi:hypothetical protein
MSATLLATNECSFRRTSLNLEQKRHRAFKQATFAIIGVLVTGLPALAQDATAPVTPKWRPKAGVYAVTGKGLEKACDEFQGLFVELAESAISGYEWNCKITRLTDTAPGAIRLEMTCDDYNLAASLKEPDEKIFKEVMLLKKIDEKRIVFRKTLNGKFKDPEYAASYCPANTQRAYLESKARSNAEAEKKRVEEKLRLHPWRPQEGVYATSGTNFNDHCLKAGDATIELSERSISSGSDKCSVTFIRDEPDDAIKMFATCGREPNAQGAIGETGNGGSTLAPPSSETIILKKIDDKTVFIQKSKNGNFTDPGEKLAYCGQDAQKMRAPQKAAK